MFISRGVPARPEAVFHVEPATGRRYEVLTRELAAWRLDIYYARLHLAGRVAA